MNKNTLIQVCLVFTIIYMLVNAVIKDAPKESEVKEAAENKMAMTNLQNSISPDFKLSLKDGTTFSFSEKVGSKPVIINFFATWCKPCKDEFPELNKFYEKHKNDVYMFAVSYETKREIDQFLTQNPIDFPITLDADKKLEYDFYVRAYPSTVFIGVDGIVKLYKQGGITNSGVYLEPLLVKEAELLRLKKGIKSQKEYFERLNNPGLAAKIPQYERLIRILKSPCHKDEMLSECNCDKAEEIKKRIRNGEYVSMTDEEAVKKINSEYKVND